jgi:hypothetical protein
MTALSEITHRISGILSCTPQILFEIRQITLALRRIPSRICEILYEISGDSDDFSLDSNRIWPISIILSEISIAIS